jgi:hypothetical protein
MKDIPILVKTTGHEFYRVGKADVTQSRTVVVYFDGRKATRHPDGNFWEGPVAPGSTGRTYALRVPVSDVTSETLMSVPVSSNVTLRGRPYDGPKVSEGRAFLFSSTALQSPNVAFGAAFVDLSMVDQTLDDLSQRGQVVSASTYRDAGSGKAVAMWVTHSGLST